MGQAQDGTFTVPSQTGAPQIDLLLQSQGEYYARSVKRELQILAANYAPVVGNRTSYANLLTYSEDFSNAAWTKGNSTITPGAYANPGDGQASMSALLEAATTSQHFISQPVSHVNGVTKIASVFVKSLSRGFAWLYQDDGTGNAQAIFDLTAGTIVSSSGGTAAIAPQGNGIYRISISFTAAHTASGITALSPSADGVSVNYPGDITKGLYAWGFQCENASGAGPYISTTSVARTISSPNIDSVDAVALQSAANALLYPGDPFAYLVDEPAPDSSGLARGFAEWVRTYVRIPKQQIIPATYLFTAPNLPPVSVGTLTTTGATSVPSGSALRVGNYAYLSIAEGAAFSGYYSPEVTFTYLAGTLTLSSASGYVVGDIVLFKDNTIGGVGFGTVATKSGNDITLSGTTVYASTGMMGKVILDALVTGAGYIRRRTRSSCHQGEIISLLARNIEDYYLPGVTDGISDYTSITPQSGFSLVAFLAAYNLSVTWFNVQSEVLKPWMFPILVQRYTQCRLADV